MLLFWEIISKKTLYKIDLKNGLLGNVIEIKLEKIKEKNYNSTPYFAFFCTASK